MTVGASPRSRGGARWVPVMLIAASRASTRLRGAAYSVAVTAGTTAGPAVVAGTSTLTETLPDASTFNPVRDLLDPAAVWEV